MSKKISTAYRLAIILQRLNDGYRLSTKSLAEEFDVNVRTIQKDLNERFDFLPIKNEDNLYFLDGNALGAMSIQDIQNFASLSGVSELYPSLDSWFISELLGERFKNTCLVKDKSVDDIGEHKELFYTLSDAISNHYIVDCFYNNKSRNLKGYKLLNNNGVWYFIADDRGELKHFTLSRIKDWVVRKESFVSNDEFRMIIDDNALEWFCKEPVEVLLAIDAKVSHYFKDRRILANQTIIEDKKECLILSTKVAYEEEVFRLVRGWIPHIKILNPISWQEKLEESLRDYLKTV